MKKINWKEVCKFLSGAFFVEAGVNWWLYLHNISVPIFGTTWSPGFLGIRGFIHFTLFLITFYIGFVRKKHV
jgi:hypothetical protein